MQDFTYITRTQCAVTGEGEFEPAFSLRFPLFCGCVNEAQSEDIIANMEFVIAKKKRCGAAKKSYPT